jgi:hypothetical protein
MMDALLINGALYVYSVGVLAMAWGWSRRNDA